MRTTRILTLTALTVAALAAAVPAFAGGGALAGGGGHGTGVCEAFADGDSTVIVLRDNCFGPISATAEAGSTVTIRNEGQQPHTYTAVDRSFDTGMLQPGESATVELPETDETLPVYCTLHADQSGNGMAGTITLSLTSEMAAATSGASSTADSGGIGTAAFALAGGFVLGSATLTALRKRREHVEPSLLER